MKIGDNVYVHGYVDEIRKDTVIIRNAGGYFGTIPNEIICGEMPEQKTGRWKMESDPYGFFEEIPVCSECGCTTEMRKTYNFCPNCGADMRGGNNG